MYAVQSQAAAPLSQRRPTDCIAARQLAVLTFRVTLLAGARLQTWLDTDGVPIRAHSAGLLTVGNDYYWPVTPVPLIPHSGWLVW